MPDENPVFCLGRAEMVDHLYNGRGSRETPVREPMNFLTKAKVNTVRWRRARACVSFGVRSIVGIMVA